MIFVGNDIVEIDRINTFIQNHKIKGLAHVFTQTEIQYCQSKTSPSTHFAGRFAAKEAVKKALLSAFPDLVLPINSISIMNKENGAPYVVFEHNASIQNKSLQVSISHSVSHATAVAILEI